MLQIAIGEDYVMVRVRSADPVRCVAFQRCSSRPTWRIVHDVDWDINVPDTTIIDVPDEALELFFQFLQKWR